MSTSPTPEGSNATGPAPQAIGVRFVKAYYQVLTTNPDQIFKFYQASSILSHGEGSNPTNASAFESYELADRWGVTKDKRFDFDNGAIDAQPSANGSILLVVTGTVVMKEDENEVRKSFVHTFFLAKQGKNYFVQNDILRFLKEKEASSEDLESVTAKATSKEEKPTEEVSKDAKPEEVPGGGVEETKETASDEISGESTAPVENHVAETKEPAKGKDGTTTPVEEKKKEGGGRKKNRGGRKSPNGSEKQQPASKPAPGSWASLVASNKGPADPPAPSSPKKAVASAKTETSDSKKGSKSSKSQEKTESSKENGKKGGGDKAKRDPDNTLVIKNLAENTKEAELLALFEKFAVETKSKIVSSTISGNRGIAFVDFDSVGPVMAAVKEHAKDPIQLNGRVLEVDQKTAEQRARKARGGAGNGGGGGRQNQKKENGNSKNGAKKNKGGR